MEEKRCGIKLEIFFISSQEPKKWCAKVLESHANKCVAGTKKHIAAPAILF